MSFSNHIQHSPTSSCLTDTLLAREPPSILTTSQKEGEPSLTTLGTPETNGEGQGETGKSSCNRGVLGCRVDVVLL